MTGHVVHGVDVNSASRDELVALDGIGESLAIAIEAARPLESRKALLTIKGIGGRLLARLEEQGLGFRPDVPTVSEQNDVVTTDREVDVTDDPSEMVEGAELMPGEDRERRRIDSSMQADTGDMDLGNVMPGEDQPDVADVDEMIDAGEPDPAAMASPPSMFPDDMAAASTMTHGSGMDEPSDMTGNGHMPSESMHGDTVHMGNDLMGGPSRTAGVGGSMDLMPGEVSAVDESGAGEIAELTGTFRLILSI